MKTYKLTNNALILFHNGIQVGSFHRLACPDWSVPSFKTWAAGFALEMGYNQHTVVIMPVDWSTLEDDASPDYGDQTEEYHKNCM